MRRNLLRCQTSVWQVWAIRPLWRCVLTRHSGLNCVHNHSGPNFFPHCVSNGKIIAQVHIGRIQGACELPATWKSCIPPQHAPTNAFPRCTNAPQFGKHTSDCPLKVSMTGKNRTAAKCSTLLFSMWCVKSRGRKWTETDQSLSVRPRQGMTEPAEPKDLQAEQPAASPAHHEQT